MKKQDQRDVIATEFGSTVMFKAKRAQKRTRKLSDKRHRKERV